MVSVTPRTSKRAEQPNSEINSSPFAVIAGCLDCRWHSQSDTVRAGLAPPLGRWYMASALTVGLGDYLEMSLVNFPWRSPVVESRLRYCLTWGHDVDAGGTAPCTSEVPRWKTYSCCSWARSFLSNSWRKRCSCWPSSWCYRYSCWQNPSLNSCCSHCSCWQSPLKFLFDCAICVSNFVENPLLCLYNFFGELPWEFFILLCQFLRRVLPLLPSSAWVILPLSPSLFS